MARRFLFCCDRNLQVGLHLSLYSLLANLPKTGEFEVYVYTSGLREDEARLVEKTVESARPGTCLFLREYKLPDYLADSPMLRGSHATYGRLFTHEDLDGGRIVYLDSDLLIEKDLSPLFDLDLQGHGFAARTNGTASGFIDRDFLCGTMGLQPDTPTFNAGVLILDVDLWREQNLSKRVKEIVEKHGDALVAHDQSALNSIAAGGFLHLDPSYNLHAKMPRAAVDRSGIPSVLHFMGAPKPWDFGAGLVNGYARKTFETLDRTALAGWRPWRTSEIRRSARNWRYFARHLMTALKRTS